MTGWERQRTSGQQTTVPTYVGGLWTVYSSIARRQHVPELVAVLDARDLVVLRVGALEHQELACQPPPPQHDQRSSTSVINEPHASRALLIITEKEDDAYSLKDECPPPLPSPILRPGSLRWGGGHLHSPISWKVLVILSLGSSPEARFFAAAGPIPGT